MLLATLIASFTAACAPGLAGDLRVQPAGAGQLITVESPAPRSTRATLRLWRKAGACWVAAGGPYPARLGWAGVSANRREGDGTTPAGTFRIHATMYGNEPDPGVAFRYVRIRCGDWWNEDPRSSTYNTFRRVGCGVRPPFRTTGEGGMWQNRRAYPYLAVVEFNMRPTVAGRGSGIFLHAQTGSATNGCISLPRAELRRVLRWLSPGARPYIAIGTRTQLTGS